MADPLRIAMNVERVQQFRDLSKRLKAAGRGDLRKALNKGIKEAGKPIVQDVRNAVQGLRTETSHVSSKKARVWKTAGEGSHGSGAKQRQQHAASRSRSTRAAANALRRSGSLRRRVAAATALEATQRGVRFVVKSAQLPESQRNLPRLMNSKKGWRHPLFGNREDWVDQKTTPSGYFSDTISKQSNRFRQNVLAQVEQIKKEIEQ